eukprot:SAG11_NODE_278_length_11284_cov_202.732231_5_plen_170_part_00
MAPAARERRVELALRPLSALGPAESARNRIQGSLSFRGPPCLNLMKLLLLLQDCPLNAIHAWRNHVGGAASQGSVSSTARIIYISNAAPVAVQWRCGAVRWRCTVGGTVRYGGTPALAGEEAVAAVCAVAVVVERALQYVRPCRRNSARRTVKSRRITAGRAALQGSVT